MPTPATFPHRGRVHDPHGPPFGHSAKMKTYVIIGGVGGVAMVLAATQWLLVGLGYPLGSAGFIVVMLCIATAILRGFHRKGQNPLGFFLTGLFLFLFGYPTYRPVMDLLEPATPKAYSDLPGEVVFGVLALFCVARAWWLWTADLVLPGQPPDASPPRRPPPAPSPSSGATQR